MDIDISSQNLLFWGPGIILGVLGFIVLCLLRTRWALAGALVILYNPFFAYRFLQLNWWEGGRLRAATSVGLLAVLAIALFMRLAVTDQPLRRVRTPVDRWLAIFAIFPLTGIAVGAYAGNDFRLLLADLFPVLEFYCFFLITTVIIQDREQAKKLMLTVLTAGAASALALVVLYFLRGYLFEAQWIVPRLMDFMPVILFPCAFGMYLHATTRRIKTLLLACSSIFLLSILLGFWRSQWIATIISMGFVLWMTKGKAVSVVRRIALFGGALVLVVLLADLGFSSIGSSHSVMALVGERTAVRGVTEMGGRLAEARDLWSTIKESPVLGRGLGGTFTTDAHGSLMRSLPLSGSHNYYLSLAAEMGLPALAVFLVSGVFLMKVGLAKSRGLQPSLPRGIAIGCLGSLVVESILFLFQAPLLHFPLPAYLGVHAAIVFIISARVLPRAVPELSVNAAKPPFVLPSVRRQPLT